MNSSPTYQIHGGISKPGDVTWAHAVNSKELLDSSLANPAIDFLEVDISLSENGEPIAAHPPARTSDLSVEDLLHAVRETNLGLKLDFKDAETVVPVLGKLASVNFLQPVMLNADILTTADCGPPKIDAKWFIDTCQNIYGRGVLSLGWRTNGKIGSSYTAANIDEMLGHCRGIKEVTFPVRGTMVKNSWDALQRLIVEDSHTLTIWNSGKNVLSEDDKRWIQDNTSPAQCFYDF